MFVQKVITDVLAEVGAFRIGIEKILKVLRREVEVTINLTAVESQIEPSALNNVSRRSQGPGFDRHPVDRKYCISISRPIPSSNRSCRGSGRHNDIPGQQLVDPIDPMISNPS